MKMPMADAKTLRVPKRLAIQPLIGMKTAEAQGVAGEHRLHAQHRHIERLRDGGHGGVENRRIQRLHEESDGHQPGQQALGGSRQRDVVGNCQASAALRSGQRRIDDGLRLADQNGASAQRLGSSRHRSCRCPRFPDGRAANQPLRADHLYAADRRAIAGRARQHLFDRFAGEFRDLDLLADRACRAWISARPLPARRCGRQMTSPSSSVSAW